MRFAIALLVTLLLAAAAAAVLVRHWTHTPYGRLSVASAVLSRVAAWQESALDGQAVADLRAERRAAIRFVSAPGTPLAAVRDTVIAGPAGPLALRVYTPVAAAAGLPVILFFHGGGWVFGDLDSHDNLCRALAARAAAVVVAVDYRLAPEHRYPAALEDASAALDWVAAHAGALGGDAARLAVAGDSAGGNIAAALSLLVRDRAGPALRAQVLIYPAVDLLGPDRASMRDFARGLFLTRERIEWFKDQYVPDRARRGEPFASPLLAADHRGLPPAVIVTAQFDPLRDEGEAYAGLLARAGVPVALRRYEGVIHGFASMDRWFPESADAVGFIAEALQPQLGSQP